MNNITDLITQEDLNRAGELATKTASSLKLTELVRKYLGDRAALFLFSKQAQKEVEKALALGEAEVFKGFLQQSVSQFTQSEEGKYVMQAVGSAFLHEKLKGYKNLGVAFEAAFEQLYHTDTISAEPISESWANRAFSYASEVYEEDVQKMWGKILAEEVVQPGSFSLRTLDVLRSLSKQEADIFIKVAGLTVGTFDSSYVVGQLSNWNEEKMNGVSFNELLLMEESGLINLTPITGSFGGTSMQHVGSPETSHSIKFMHAKRVFGMNLVASQGAFCRFNSMKLTKTGHELLRMVDTDVNVSLVKRIYSEFVSFYGDVPCAINMGGPVAGNATEEDWYRSLSRAAPFTFD